ncbi:hypothetical protein GRX03_05290 [Halovenus sp. WSH3]|uniref:Halobacterial output domain-containing protein n=1 Tax=Halovenus carboxidivorans TaxID=2692199 RepID=A0A6B0T7Z5_9EURY|nr:HalOD1 output domain-containing protein [Halovenus carboxidivorans]MXR51020.1 hypothetical protein [Halovenus carboxidivorans]
MTRRHEVLTAVVGAIAEAEDCSPQALSYSLAEYVETGALATLAASEHTEWELTFEVPDHTVTVRGDGAVLVDDVLRERLDAQSRQLS